MYDALAAAVAQVRGSALGAARIVLLSDGDDVGQRHEPGRGTRPSSTRRRSAFHGRHRVSRLQGGGPPEDRGRDRRNVRRCVVAGGADEDLRRARIPARQRVPAALSVHRAAGPERRRRGRRQGQRAGVLLLQSPATGTAAPYQPAVPRQALPVVAADPADRRPGPRAGRLHHPLALEPPLEPRAASRGSATSSRCLPRSRRASGGRKSTRCSPLSASRSRRSARAVVDRTGSRRTSTSRRSSTTRAG